MCKKHNWAFLYRPTDETDKIGWQVANAISGRREAREVVCIECGAIGYQRRSRRAGVAIYPNQLKEALRAAALCQELKLEFPKL